MLPIRKRLARFFFFASASYCLTQPLAHAQQTSNTLTQGSIVVKLKRLATFPEGADANVLYGTFAPGNSNLFVVQQGSPSPTFYSGRVRYFNPAIVDSPVGTLLDFNTQLPGTLDTTHFEKGLLCVAFHPDFNNPAKPGYLKLYTYSTEKFSAHGVVDYIHPETTTNTLNNVSTLREWTATSLEATSAVPSRVLLRIADPQNQHNAGTIAFSPIDGYLYWALGDGGGNSSTSPDFDATKGGIASTTDGHSNSTGPGVPHGNGQDRTNPLGAMLRINPFSAAIAPDPAAVPSANNQYQIPTNNPFTRFSNIDPLTSQPYANWNSNWVAEMFAYGLRNPYRFSFDRGTNALDPNRGKLYEGDAGYNRREEVNLIERGKNYGWVIREGTRSMEGEQGIPAYTAPVNAATGLPDALIDPIAEYDYTVGQAMIGGFVYRGVRIPALRGKYIFGDWRSRRAGENGVLFYFDTNETKATNAPFTIYRLSIDPTGDSVPVADLLGFGQDISGEIYAMFDNGQVVALYSQTEPVDSPQISVELVSDEVHLTFPTQSGKNYRAEYKQALEDTNWTELQTIPGTGLAEQINDAPATNTTRFYRVVVE